MEDSTREGKQLQESSLPRAEWLGMKMVKHLGYWYPETALQGAISFQTNFQALDTDIFVATKPKSGTTWLKALVFAVVNRHRFPPDTAADHPLSKANPHELVPFIEMEIYTIHDKKKNNPFPELTPRILGTHCAFENLPESFKKNNTCRVVYMCRNPLDVFASSWHFIPAMDFSKCKDDDGGGEEGGGPSLEVNFDKFCNGVEAYGPFLDHVLGYWKASRERPDKVLFIMYEDVKQRPDVFVKMTADFLGCSFSSEEERDGKVEEITRLCSFESLRDMEVNKHGVNEGPLHRTENKLFFRKGEVGDWVNLLTPSMAQRYHDIAKHKLHGSGLSFKFATTTP